MFIRQSLAGRIVSQVLVLFALVLLAIPLLLIVQQSLEGQGPQNYVAVLTATPFFRFAANSAFIAVCVVLLVLVSAMTAAYAVELLRPRGAAVMSFVILAGLTLPPIAVIVPLFALFSVTGILDTYWAVILPVSASSIPFGFLLSRNYIRELPIEVYEAARLDGAGRLRYLWSVLLPLSTPILSVIAIFAFLGAWNEYVLPLVFIQSEGLEVATQVPTYFQSEHLVDLPKVFAANVLISLPVITLYIVLQRQFRRGLSGGAVK